MVGSYKLVVSERDWNDELVKLVRRRGLSVVRKRKRSGSGREGNDELLGRSGRSLSPRQIDWLFILLPIAMGVTICIMRSLPEAESPSNQKTHYTCWQCRFESDQRTDTCPNCRVRY